MVIKYSGVIIIIAFSAFICPAQQKYGATIPWTTLEAENMKTTGTVMGPKYDPYQVETESSGQKCVKLGHGQFVEFNAPISANVMVIRFSLPDKKEGGGLSATLGIYKNGSLLQRQKVSSRFCYLYGKYPFTNDPAAGETRNFYDEIRIADLQIGKGDVVRIKRDDSEGHDAEYCIIDLVDLENIAPSLKAPANSLPVTDKSFLGNNFSGDYTDAFRKCIAQASETGKSVWIPAGTFKITGDLLLPENTTIQGAGMWYSTLVGDATLYTDANRRVRLKGNGSAIHLSDFSIVGKLDYRNDNEPNDGIVGSFGTNSTISRIWIEHTKVGMWIENSKNLKIAGCRMRNTIADGINFCVGMTRSTIENCTARGTGDDCFAIWPAVFMKQLYAPGQNVVSHCTAQLPFLANGAAIYGGESNEIKNCSFSDISQGSAVLISTTFPTVSDDKTVNNNFSGTTVVKDCLIKTSGGFDHEWDWRAAVEIAVDKRSISGIEMSGLRIENSLSNAVSIITKKEQAGVLLSNAVLENIHIGAYGIGVKDKSAIYISKDALGSLGIKKSGIPKVKNESKNFSVLNQ